MLSVELRKKLDGISKCSIKGQHKVKNLFKILTNNLELWDWAHQEIASNKGATTRGVDDVTVDGYSDERAIALMELLKQGKYQPQPVRRTYIPKANGKQRPLGIPNDHDKLVQSACKILLEAIYEPVFHEHSYGFRPKRGCHDALMTINRTWRGTKWFIEFDIKGYFDNINHKKLMDILSEKIDDDRFLALIRKMLKAGYMENFVYNKTWSGTPQGGVISPILANIYLDKLDRYVEGVCSRNTRGKFKKPTQEYKQKANKLRNLKNKIQRRDKRKGLEDETYQIQRKKFLEEYREIQRDIMATRPTDDFDQSFRKLHYCRYADDFVLGYIGSKAEAEGIMAEIKTFLEDELLLEASEEKTKIESHKVGIQFLGYELRTDCNEYFKRKVVNGAVTYTRYGGTIVKLWVPWDKLKDYCNNRNYGNWTEVTSTHRSYLVNLSDAEILSTYNAELRGICQYYKLAYDYSRWLWRLFYIADYSCRKTLAAKHKSTVYQISRRNVKRTSNGDKRLSVRIDRNDKEIQLVKPKDVDRNYRFGKSVETYDNISQFFTGRNDLTKRRKLEICEACGTKTPYVEEHHIRALKDIRKSAKWWEKQMIARNRKTLILCVSCHDQIHSGTLPDLRKMA